jgi:hypothetical protein
LPNCQSIISFWLKMSDKNSAEIVSLPDQDNGGGAASGKEGIGEQSLSENGRNGAFRVRRPFWGMIGIG